jgi:puromycin-sensitive aminopeptidase
MGKDVKRLFYEFEPTHYALELDADRESMIFSGQVIITGKKIKKPSRRLTFHQKGLKITGAHITRHDKKGDQDIAVTRINNQDSYEEVRLHADELLYPGNYTVRMAFSGKITRAMNGLYPCFFEADGKKKTLLATQFESHHAREVFPCIDEPQAKATFDLTLHTIPGETVIANTPVKQQSETDGKLVTSFETTPHMSTYLLAFVTGELDHLEAKTRDGVLVRTYATAQNVEFTRFALDVAVQCLEFYNDYFGIPYPLPKCDMIALPDFASGAMENWGCITYREQAMLVDPDNTTLGSKQYVAMVVAHELAHQWFGNLVTMRWWTDLWLNEGFASWIEYMAVDHLFPEWEMWTQFTVDEQQQALKLDALEHTHPIEVPVHHPDEIRTIFDAISYSKGASVIHMLHEYLGPDSFREGLSFYLQQRKYHNTDTVDLWKALEEASGKPVQSFMHAWTSLPGFPVLHINAEEREVAITQERFLLNPEHGEVPISTWPVALLADQPGVTDILDVTSNTFKISDTQNLKINRGQSGFYRVTYNATHLKRLGELIREGKLPVLDRLGILADVFETAKAGESDTVDALHFIGHFKDESNYAAWDVISAAIGSLRVVMNDEELREAMKPYIRKLVAPQLERLGWERQENESHFDRLLRPIILGLAASADETWVVRRCQEFFAAIEHTEDIAPHLRTAISGSQLKRGIDVDPDLRGTVFGTVARLGNEKEFKKLLALHNTSNLSEERNTLAAALTGFRQPELIQQALGLITTDTVRLQDVAYWIAYSFLNRFARRQTWDWMKTHWDWLHDNLGSDLSFYRMPIYAARVFSDREFMTDYQAFFEPRLNVALDRSYKQGLEMLQWQAAWKERAFKEVQAFFKQQSAQ